MARSAGPALVVAAWARYCEAVDEEGQPIDVVDGRGISLVANARRQREDPLAFVADRELFGDLVDDERFTSLYRAALASLHERGARATLQAAVEDPRFDGLTAEDTTRGPPEVRVAID